MWASAEAESVRPESNGGVLPTPSRRLFKRLVQSKTGLIGLVLVSAVIVISLFAPLLAPHDPALTNAKLRLMPPAWEAGGTGEYLLGTDNLGRDVLSRMIYGSRVSLIVGVCSVVLSGAIGVVLGLVSGYYGRWLDRVIMRVVDAFLAIPTILFTLVTIFILKPGLWTLILVIGFTHWVTYARLIRSEVLSVKELAYVKAARAVGASDFRIIFAHILPNVSPSLIVISTLSVAHNILLEASLSFLGLGIQPPDVSWGGMLSDGRQYLATSWWVATFPGIAVTITVLGIIFLGDWLRDVLDPRLKT